MIAIRNTRIYPVDGPPIENGTILIDGSKIAAVGRDIRIPEEAEVVDAGGRASYPGFIDAHCHVGMQESAIGFEGDDVNEMTDPVTPDMRAIDGFNPMDATVAEARNAGVTAAATGPGSANPIGGTFMVIKMAGHRVDDMVVKDPLAMKIAFGENPKRVYSPKQKTPMTRMGTAAIIREALAKAVRYKEQIERAGDDPSKLPAYDAKMEALLPVVRRQIPLKAHAHRADDIYTSLRIAEEFGLDITLDHCTEGHLIADDLAKFGARAIVGPSFGHKSKFELTNKTFETAGALAKAGVKVAIMTDSPVNPLSSLPLMAGMAVQAGMDREEAIKAITLNAAEILGLHDRLGSLTPGKDADLSIFDGDPLEISGSAWMVFIDGKIVFRK